MSEEHVKDEQCDKGDDEAQAGGRFRRAAGSVRDNLSEAIDQLQDIGAELRAQARAQPLLTLFAAAGVGFMLGRFWPRRHRDR